MMEGKIKVWSLVLLLSCSVPKAEAQLDGSGIAPDFTLTDIDGGVHTLYDYLNQDKVVVLDFFAVWCSICKADAAYLEAVYDQYGPQGSGEIVMLSVETDDASTDEQTRVFAAEFGAGNPHINQTENLAALYNQQFFPLYYVIAPDRSYQIIEGRQERLQMEMEAAIVRAPGLRTVANDLRVLSYDSPFGSICEDRFYPQVRVQNYGSNTVESMFVETLVDGVLKSRYPWVETIEPYHFVDLRLPWVPNLSDGWHRIDFRFSEVNGQEDGEVGNGITGGDFLILSQGESVGISISTDPYPKETSWKLMENGKILAHAGDYTQGLKTDTTAVCAQPNACYRLVLYDAYGDGMSAGGASVVFRGETIARIDAVDFAKDSVWVDFCLWPLGFEVFEKDQGETIGLYPNPSEGEFTLEWNDPDHPVEEIRILNVTGQTVWHKKSPQLQNNLSVDLSDSPAGVYFVRLKTSDGIVSHRLVLNR